MSNYPFFLLIYAVFKHVRIKTSLFYASCYFYEKLAIAQNIRMQGQINLQSEQTNILPLEANIKNPKTTNKAADGKSMNKYI